MLNKFLCALLIISFAGCSSLSKSEKGSIIGAGAGAVIGGVIGKAAADKTTAGVVIGAAVGGVAGGIIGAQMDKQAEELDEELENAKVERVGEGIVVTFNSAILFGFDSSELSNQAKLNLVDLASSLKEYPRTNVRIAGHTDSTGPEDYNKKLSERRAMAAAVFLAENDIDPDRLTIVGYGEAEPVASNDTDAGRAQNRRVEVAIVASEEYRQELEAEYGSN